VVEILTDSPTPRDYWYRIKQREKISGIELSTICRQFKLEAQDGKLRETDCADTEGLLRIIQSIPSPKAEPFKRWLARVGYRLIFWTRWLSSRFTWSSNSNRTIRQIRLSGSGIIPLWNNCIFSAYM